MAYNYGFPMSYQPYSYAQNNGIIWVQGEAGAKAYPVAAGNSVVLLDSENSVFYVKSTDTSGMPMPLRVFDFTERTSQPKVIDNQPEYVTREEFEKKLAELTPKKSKKEE